VEGREPETAAADSYETVPYPELIHPHTHPDRLAVAGRLLGMRPAAADACRVLELGCGPGVNLVAMAQDLPRSHFVGIDSSPQHVARAREIIEAAALTNVDVRLGDIRSWDAGSDRYDFVLAHGVYSWVEADARSALLRVIGHVLAPEGLAFVSYNTYPGWFVLRGIREMMLFHARGEQDPVTRARKGAELLTFLLEHVDAQSSGYATDLARCKNALESRFGLLETERVASILHDELAPVNEPVFFHDFARRAESVGLQYVAEADLRGSTPVGLTPDLVRGIRGLASDLTSLEQYMDFVSNRTFRQTLLCRIEVSLNRTLTPGGGVLEDLFLFSETTPPDDLDALMAGAALRVIAGDAQIVTDHALSKAALGVLAAASPRSLPWTALVAQAADVAGSHPVAGEDLDRLSATLLRAFFASRSLVALSTLPDRFTTRVSSRPVVGPLVRLLAASGQPRVPNRRHERIVLDPLALPVVASMDGRHALDELRCVYTREDQPLESLLESLARSALLVS
jgi:SAM-dependent methyltransferase